MPGIASDGKPNVLMRLPGSSLNQPWFKTLMRAEDEFSSGHVDNAKQLWLDSLKDLEQSRYDVTQGDHFFTPRLSVLEERLTEYYTQELPKRSDEDEHLQLMGEQVDVLERLSVLNRLLIPRDLLATMSTKRYTDALAALNKATAAKKKQDAGK